MACPPPPPGPTDALRWVCAPHATPEASPCVSASGGLRRRRAALPLPLGGGTAVGMGLAGGAWGVTEWLWVS